MPVVLLVEDNADTREMYASFLGAEGFRVLEAEDGLQALCQLAGEKPDLMLLDLGLPRLSGVQVLRAIRQQPRLADLPVVVVSGGRDRGRRNLSETVRTGGAAARGAISARSSRSALAARPGCRTCAADR